MKFFNIFLFVFACIALTTISAAPEPCLLDKLKSIGQTILDGIVNSNPSLKVASTAAKIAKETTGLTIVDAVKEIPVVQALEKAADLAMGQMM